MPPLLRLVPARGLGHGRLGLGGLLLRGLQEGQAPAPLRGVLRGRFGLRATRLQLPEALQEAPGLRL